MNQQVAPRRPDASMTLLIEMMERPLDPGYAAAAERREASGLPPATSLRSWRVVAAALVIGLLIGGSASVLRASATGRNEARSALVQQIDQGRTLIDQRTATLRDLRAELSRLDEGLLGASAGELSGPISIAAGAGAVSGPGFVVTLDDARGADTNPGDSDPRSGKTRSDTVQAVDIQTVVNGLWQAGAEAIAINGQRLSATAAIRFAGEAILVDFRPLTRPYVIEAIGDPQRMPAAFADGRAGSYLSTLSSAYGLSVATTVSKRIELPGAATLAVRAASPLPSGDTGPAPTPTPAPEPPS